MTVTQTESTGKTGKLTVGSGGQKDAPSAVEGWWGRVRLPHTHHPGAGAPPTVNYEVSTVFVSSWKAMYLGMGASIVESSVQESVLGECPKTSQHPQRRDTQHRIHTAENCAHSCIRGGPRTGLLWAGESPGKG